MVKYTLKARFIQGLPNKAEKQNLNMLSGLLLFPLQVNDTLQRVLYALGEVWPIYVCVYLYTHK